MHLLFTSLVLAVALYLSLLAVTGAVMRIRDNLDGSIVAGVTALGALAWALFYYLIHS